MNTKEAIIKDFEERFTFKPNEAPNWCEVLFRINEDRSISLALPKDIKNFLSEICDQVKQEAERETAKTILETIDACPHPFLGRTIEDLYVKYLNKDLKSETKEEIPTQHLLDSLQESEEDYKAGRYKSFAKGQDALDYLAKKEDEKV